MYVGTYRIGTASDEFCVPLVFRDDGADGLNLRLKCIRVCVYVIEGESGKSPPFLNFTLTHSQTFSTTGKLEAAVASHTAVPTSEVYPNFITLAETYVMRALSLMTALWLRGAMHLPVVSTIVPVSEVCACPCLARFTVCS